MKTTAAPKVINGHTQNYASVYARILLLAYAPYSGVGTSVPSIVNGAGMLEKR